MSAFEIRRYAHPREFPVALQALFAQAERGDIESGAHWYANLIDTVFPAPQHQAVFYVLQQGEQPLAALPLLRVPRRLGMELHSLSNYYTARWQPVLAEDAPADALEQLVRGLREHERGLRALRLDCLDEEPAARLAQVLRACGFAGEPHFRFKNWTLETVPDWAAYLASRKGKQRSDLKRMGAKLRENGGQLSICFGQDAAELEQALGEFTKVYGASWKRPEPYVEFVPGLVRQAAAQGWLRLGRVHLQGQAIASQIWLVHAGRASIYKVAYDEAFKAYSPGSLCTALLMEHVMEQDRVTQVDYLIGDDAYKRLWMNRCADRQALLSYNLRHPIGCLGAFREWLARQSRPLRERWRGWRERRQPPVTPETA